MVIPTTTTTQTTLTMTILTMATITLTMGMTTGVLDMITEVTVTTITEEQCSLTG